MDLVVLLQRACWSRWGRIQTGGCIPGMACNGFLDGLLPRQSSTIISTTSSTDIGSDKPCSLYNMTTKMRKDLELQDGGIGGVSSSLVEKGIDGLLLYQSSTIISTTFSTNIGGNMIYSFYNATTKKMGTTNECGPFSATGILKQMKKDLGLHGSSAIGLDFSSSNNSGPVIHSASNSSQRIARY